MNEQHVRFRYFEMLLLQIWDLYGGADREQVLNVRLSQVPCNLRRGSFLVKVYLRTPKEKEADPENSNFPVDKKHYAGKHVQDCMQSFPYCCRVSVFACF